MIRSFQTLLKLAIVLYYSAGLVACMTLGPDYEEPDVQWLEEWQPSLYRVKGTETIDNTGDNDTADHTNLADWWRLFDDPILNTLQVIAKQENVSLQIAGLRILESQAQLNVVKGGQYPQVQQIDASMAYNKSKEHGDNATQGAQSFSSYQTGFSLAWELDFWGRFSRSIESADAAFFSSIANQRDAQVLLSAQIASTYYAYRTLQERIKISKHNAHLQKRSYAITEQIYKSGENSELDLQQAKTQYLSTLSSIPDLDAALQRTQNSLSALLGRPPGKMMELLNTPDRLPAANLLMLEDVPAGLMMRRPDIRSAAWQVAAQSAQIGVAKADVYPSITLFGNIGWSANSHNSDTSSTSFSAGPALQWNIFNYGRLTNNTRVQDARLQQLIGGFQNAVLQAAREIDDAAITIVKTEEKQSVLKESVESAERSLVLANTRYREGYADFQRVLEAQRAVASQSEREIINQGDHIAAVIRFYQALGGGWVDAPLEEWIPENTQKQMYERVDWGDLLGEQRDGGKADTL